MYQLIALLFLASAFAQVDPKPDCSESELEQRCFSSVCSNSTTDRLPRSMQELESALKQANYRMPEEKSNQIDQFVNALVDMNKKSTALVQSRGYDGIADDILSNLDQNFQPLYEFFRPDIPFIHREDGSFDFIVSDMMTDQALGKRMAGFLKSYFELYYGLTKARERVNQPGAVEFYRNLLKDTEAYYTETKSPRLNDLVARRLSLNANSSAANIAGAVIPLLTQEDVRAVFKKRFLGAKKDLTEFIRNRADENSGRVTKGLQPGPIKDSIVRSCALADYMVNRVAKNMTPERAFGDARRAATRGFYDKFTVKLSEHSRKFLEGALTDDVFVPVQFDANIYPDYPKFTDGLKVYAQNMNPSVYLMQTNVFEVSTQFVCAIDSFLPEDHFQDGKINTSVFAIAAGHPDILAHELGHWVSAQMDKAGMSETSRAKFNSLRKCISGFYQDKTGMRVEEDFADWFMNTTVPSTQISCSFDTVVPLMANYLLGKELPQTDMFSPVAGDPHSANLFRELHGRLVRGEKLSLPCRQLMTAHPDARPLKCEL